VSERHPHWFRKKTGYEKETAQLYYPACLRRVCELTFRQLFETHQLPTDSSDEAIL